MNTWWWVFNTYNSVHRLKITPVKEKPFKKGNDLARNWSMLQIYITK